MKSLIKKIDFFPHKAALTFNPKGDIGYKTFIGGLISMLSIIFSFICGFYFLYRMFLRKDMSVIFSNEINPFSNISYSHKLPFLLRMSDTDSLPYEEDERLYYITASIWYGGSNDTNISITASQHSVSLNIGKCDIDKHFADEYKSYFLNYKELDKYYCITPRNYSQTIYGLYGNVYPFSYYSFTIRKCKNTTENNNKCYSEDEILDKVQQPYLDLVFIDYTLNSLKTKDVKELIVRKERYELSNSIYKRIWLYLDNIKYIIDRGYIFSDENEEYFHSFDSIRTDINYYPFSNAIATLTVLNSVKNSIYNKQYTKAQDYLAIIGGLVKVITLCCTLLNYYNSVNSYYLKIIKDFVKDKVNEKKIEKNNQINNIIPSVIGKTKSNLESSIDVFSRNNQGFAINSNNKHISKFNNNFRAINKSVTIKILPSLFSNKQTTKTLSLYKEFINDRLNIINVLKKLEFIDLGNQKIIPNFNENNDSFKQIVNKKSNFVVDG